MKSRIHYKLLATFLIPIVFIVALGAFSYNMAASEIEKQVKVSSVAAVKSQGEYLHMVSNMVKDASTQIIRDANIQKYFSPAGETLTAEESQKLSTEIEGYLKGLMIGNDTIRSISIIGQRKTISTDTTIQIKNLKEIEKTQLYQAAEQLSGKAVWAGNPLDISMLYGQKNRREQAFSCVRVVKSTLSGEVIGVVIIELKPDFVQMLLNNIRFEEGTEVRLITPDGFDQSVAVKEDSYADATSFSQTDIYRDIMGGKETQGSISVLKLNQENLAVYDRRDDIGVLLVSLIPVSVLLEGSHTILLVTVIMVLTAVLVSFLIAFRLSKGISGTINKIVDASEKAAYGILTVKPKTTRQDELGKLTDSIGKMIDNMRLLITQSAASANNVSQSTDELLTACQETQKISEEINQAVDDIARGALQQANDSEKGFSIVSKLAENIGIVSETTKKIEDISKATMDCTQNGLSTINVLDEKARQTNNFVQDILNDIKTLNEYSKSIGKIVNMINSITDQTNLLSLNAAIEAARAGEYGKGFAVVSHEIRNLAMQSLNSTKEISGIVLETQKKTELAVKKAKMAEEVLNSQNMAFRDAVGSFDTIEHSMAALASKVNEILSDVQEMERCKAEALLAMQNISSVCQQTAATTQEVDASTEQQMDRIRNLSANVQRLKTEADALQKSIKRFTI